MNRRRFLLIFGSGLLVASTATAFGMRRSFQKQIDREVAELLGGARSPAVQTVSEVHLEPLPEPVQRWLRAAGVVGTAIPMVVRLWQEGEFRLGPDKRWIPMETTEYFTTDPPGFLWHASMDMFPLVEVTGRDRYVQGTGDIEMRIASIYPVARKSRGNLDTGALLRYLNETMWFPAALVLPNVSWEPTDESSARATLTDGGQSVSAVFYIDPEGRLVNMTAERWNDTEQAFLPWSTPLTERGTFEGITVPTAGSGVWKIDADAYEYIKLRVTALVYDPPEDRSQTRKPQTL